MIDNFYSVMSRTHRLTAFFLYLIIIIIIIVTKLESVSKSLTIVEVLNSPNLTRELTVKLIDQIINCVTTDSN